MQCFQLRAYFILHPHQCLVEAPIIISIAGTPASYFFPTAEAISVNGSSATGNCSSVTSFSNNGLSRCDAPTSSVLFDNNVPTLTGDMFASQLLTLQLMQNTIPTHRELIFDFTGTSTSFSVEIVELVMFNCPERGIAVQNIRLHTAPSIMMTGQRFKHSQHHVL